MGDIVMNMVKELNKKTGKQVELEFDSRLEGLASAEGNKIKLNIRRVIGLDLSLIRTLVHHEYNHILLKS